MSNTQIAAIVLAGGQGKRIASTGANKVTLSIAGTPIIRWDIDLLKSIGTKPIIVVVGFAKESVIAALVGEDILFAVQKEQLGTGNAVSEGLNQLPKGIRDVLVLNGDDALFLNEKIVGKLIAEHTKTHATVTLLTMQLGNPLGIGRVKRDRRENVIAIVEEKDASKSERKITEVNGIGYMFAVDFLKKYLPKLEKSSVTGEYYLTGLVALAAKNKENVQAVSLGKIPWRGINTKEDLRQAEKLFVKRKSH